MRTLFTLILLAAVPLAATAQERAVDPTKVLAPYVDELTYAVGIVDAQSIDLDALLARFAQAGAPKAEVAAVKAQAAKARDALVKAGGRYVCFTFNMADGLSDGPLIVVPVDEGGDTNKIAALLASLPGMQTKIKDGAVLAAKKDALERALQRTPAAAPVFAQALKAVDGLPIRAALAMPAPLRLSVEESVPKLPRELGGGPVTPVTRGLSWGAAGVNLSTGKLQVRAVVQARDKPAAAELGRLAGRFLELQGAKAGKEGSELAKALERLRPQVKDDQLRLALDAEAVDATLLPLLANVRAAASRAQSFNNLKQIGLAMHSYYDVYKSLPAQASFDKEKRPLLSWRVHLLPFIDENELYKQFKLDEPWDSAANKPLIAKMPTVYRSPFIVKAAAGETTYLVPVAKDFIFDGPKKTKFAQIRDGTANTILVVEVAEVRAVPWTKPADYDVDRKKPKEGLMNPGAAGFPAAFADGSVHFMSRELSDDAIWNYFCPNDGMPPPADPPQDK